MRGGACILSGNGTAMATHVPLPVFHTVPLAFLEAARSAHVETGSFATCTLDVTYAAVDDIRGFDVVVCADMLYNTDVATALGALLGAAACGAGAPRAHRAGARQRRAPVFFVTCHSGRAREEDLPLPAWRILSLYSSEI